MHVPHFSETCPESPNEGKLLAGITGEVWLHPNSCCLHDWMGTTAKTSFLLHSLLLDLAQHIGAGPTELITAAAAGA